MELTCALLSRHKTRIARTLLKAENESYGKEGKDQAEEVHRLAVGSVVDELYNERGRTQICGGGEWRRREVSGCGKTDRSRTELRITPATTSTHSTNGFEPTF